MKNKIKTKSNNLIPVIFMIRNIKDNENRKTLINEPELG